MESEFCDLCELLFSDSVLSQPQSESSGREVCPLGPVAGAKGKPVEVRRGLWALVTASTGLFSPIGEWRISGYKWEEQFFLSSPDGQYCCPYLSLSNHVCSTKSWQVGGVMVTKFVAVCSACVAHPPPHRNDQLLKMTEVMGEGRYSFSIPMQML